jgi:DNA polymerase-3 subunit gamma/tau
MRQALYRKYRSKSLGEIVGQEHITDTLAKALKAGKISHAYLFTGPRGVGKTSIARILAHELNGLPYDKAGGHIDIIEIDAASNNGVEDVRDLREKVYVAPAQAKYKVYIIDEVHMLSKAAFNALLKTLEEPPAHVVFILATTEAHKLPETITSRTQRFVFRPIDTTKAIAHMKTIAQAEKIAISDDALALIVQHGRGSFRDSISLLDQLSSKGAKVELADVQTLLGIAPQKAIAALAKCVVEGEPSADIYRNLSTLLQQGYQPASIAQQLSTVLRAEIINGHRASEKLVAVLSALLEVPVSHDPEAQLEITLLTAGSPARQPQSPASVASEPVAMSKSSSPSSATEQPRDEQTKSKSSHSEKSSKAHSDPPTESHHSSGGTGSTSLDASNWQEVLNILKKQHNTLYGIVRMAQPDFGTPGTLTLAFNFAFHQKRANEAKNRKVIGDAIVAVAGGPVEIICIQDAEAVPPKVTIVRPAPTKADSPQTESLASISNIFGGGELIQSD